MSAFHICYSPTFTANFSSGKTYGATDDTPRLDNADDARHSNASDTDRARLFGEDYFRTEDCRLACHTEQGHYHIPNKCAAGKDDEAVFQPHDISQAKHCRAGVDFKHHLCLSGYVGSYLGGFGGERFSPPAEGGEKEVVDTTYQAGDDERLGLVAGFLARDEHLSGGCGFREGELAVHIRAEIFAEGDKHQDAEYAAQ